MLTIPRAPLLPAQDNLESWQKVAEGQADVNAIARQSMASSHNSYLARVTEDREGAEAHAGIARSPKVVWRLGESLPPEPARADDSYDELEALSIDKLTVADTADKGATKEPSGRVDVLAPMPHLPATSTGGTADPAALSAACSSTASSTTSPHC